MKNKVPNIFGKQYLELFEIGDCVSYSTLNGEKIIGIITKIYVRTIENDVNRQCAFADVRNMYGDFVPIILGAIKLESKVICDEKGKNTNNSNE